jgi:hypothetical protein
MKRVQGVWEVWGGWGEDLMEKTIGGKKSKSYPDSAPPKIRILSFISQQRSLIQG